MEIPIIVIDANIILPALKSRKGKSNQLLRNIGIGKFDFAISIPLILEYESILKQYLDRNYYTNDDIDNFINYLCYAGKKIKLFYLWRPYLKDPYDDHILELVIHSHSKYIIAYNKKDFKEAEHLGIVSLTPAEFMNKIQEETK